MKHTLYLKFLFFYAILGIIGFLLISTLGSDLIGEELVQSTSSSLYREASMISDNLTSGPYLESSNLQSTYYNLQSVAAYQNSQIWIISTNGEILLNTAEPLHVDSPEKLQDFDPVALGSGYYSIGKFFNSFEEDMLSVIVPVSSEFRNNGYVAIHISVSELFWEREHILGRIYILFGGIYLLFLLYPMLFIFSVYHPLQKIIHGTMEYASGNLKYQIPIRTDDEMGYLASTLNYMSEELDKAGENQRKLVANISHDFRSPLTSIKGYIEAIADGTIPPEMQEKYLNVVLFETERLTKLTQGLLTLNKMDDRGNILELSDFDINAVIKNTAASFEGTCRKKRITIELLLAARTLYVNADMGKIQQVLYNLLDNAIKFSPYDSTIIVETTDMKNSIIVSVKDSGCGIPKKDINRIWERFYKIDSSRGKDRKGTGLGLSIVKEIINSHNQNISVISTEGVGTEFTFSLPKAKKSSQE